MRSMPYDSRLASYAKPRRVGRSRVFLLTHILVTSLVVGAGAATPIDQLDSGRLVYPASLLATATLVWILWSWYSLRKTLFDPYALFMIAAGLFNSGQALLEVFGMNPGGILLGEANVDTLIRSLFLVAISMLLVHAGALAALDRKSRQKPSGSSDSDREKATRLTGWMLMGVAFVPTFNLLKGSFDLVLDYGYMGLYTHRIATPLSYALAGFMVPGLIFLMSGSRKSRWIQLFCLSFMALYAGAFLFFGARAAATMSCVAVAWVYESSIRRIPRTLITLLAIAALLIFPLVRETRNLSGKDRLSMANQYETVSNLENPGSSSISEMGHSLVTVTDTLTLVPEIRPFDLGASYFYAATTIVPNLGWEVHPAVAHGLLSDWLIDTVDPIVAEAGGGLGFSFIAESYLNFGWIGGPLCLGLIGFLVASLFLMADSPDPAKRAMVGSFLSFFFVFARGESAIVARGLVWYAVMPYLVVTALTIRNRRRKALA